MRLSVQKYATSRRQHINEEETKAFVKCWQDSLSLFPIAKLDFKNTNYKHEDLRRRLSALARQMIKVL